MKVLGRIIFTISIFLCILGCAGAFGGWQERTLAANATMEPISVDLAKLESGEKLPGNHVKIGAHYAYYDNMVLVVETKNGFSTLQHVYYPIISPEHPDAKKLQEVVKENGGVLAKVDPSLLPDLSHFVVIVKSKRFKNEADAQKQDAVVEVNAVQGMVINDIDSLDSDEKKIIKEKIPSINFDKVLILEANRKPSSMNFALALLFGGICLFSVGGLGFIGGLILYIKN